MKNLYGGVVVLSSIEHHEKVVVDAARLRRAIFVDELGLLDDKDHNSDIELDPYDRLDTTFHFVAYRGDPSTDANEPIGASRLLAPSDTVARELGTTLGLPMEASYDLSLLKTRGIRPAEVSRLGVLRERRGSGAFKALHEAMLAASRRRGWTHWLAAANMITDCRTESEMIMETLKAKGLMHADVRVGSRCHAMPPNNPTRRIYSEDQRRLASSGELTGVRLPDTLALFVRCNAQAISAPLYEEKYRVFSIGIMIALTETEPIEAFRPRSGRW
jgi:hypothetical protein